MFIVQQEFILYVVAPKRQDEKGEVQIDVFSKKGLEWSLGEESLR